MKMMIRMTFRSLEMFCNMCGMHTKLIHGNDMKGVRKNAA